MVQLLDNDIKTREVLDWKGVHILHFAGSSCSQKLRVFLNLKGIPWQSHLVDLPSNENFRPWFLGINPRGLVPVLVHDGAVHIESNDIIVHLERAFPEPRLIPKGHESEVSALLRHEDDLHLDLRTLSFRFVFAPPGPPKPAEALASYAASGTGTVRGEIDSHKQEQIDFWQRAAREGFTGNLSSPQARAVLEAQIGDQRPVASSFPGHEEWGGLLVSREGQIWIKEFRRPFDQGAERWFVFHPSGNFACQIMIPAGTYLFDVGKEYLLGREKDGVDVEYVVKRTYQLPMASAGS